jgi:hypothetical protein
VFSDYNSEVNISGHVEEQCERRKFVRPGDFRPTDMENAGLAGRYFDVAKQAIIDLRHRITELQREIKRLRKQKPVNDTKNQCDNCKVGIFLIDYNLKMFVFTIGWIYNK